MLPTTCTPLHTGVAEFPLITYAEEQHEKSSLLYENIPGNHKHSTIQGLLIVISVNQLNSNVHTHVYFSRQIFFHN